MVQRRRRSREHIHPYLSIYCCLYKVADLQSCLLLWSTLCMMWTGNASICENHNVLCVQQKLKCLTETHKCSQDWTKLENFPDCESTVLKRFHRCYIDFQMCTIFQSQRRSSVQEIDLLVGWIKHFGVLSLAFCNDPPNVTQFSSRQGN